MRGTATQAIRRPGASSSGSSSPSEGDWSESESGLEIDGQVRSENSRFTSRILCRFRKYVILYVLGAILLFNIIHLVGTQKPRALLPPPSEDHEILLDDSSTTYNARMRQAQESTGDKASMWVRSYKLISDGFHQLKAGWNQKRSDSGSISIIPSSSTRRCALPDESTMGDFFLSGQGFDRIPPPDPSTLKPRGIVIASSGTVERLAIGAYITSYLIRKVYRSKLPIEIYYVSQREAFTKELTSQLEALGDVYVIDLVQALEEKYGRYHQHSQQAVVDEGEAGAEAEAEAEAEASVTADKGEEHVVAEAAEEEKEQVKSTTRGRPGQWSYLDPTIPQIASYAAKPYSILASSFKENILFDAGAVPFLDPEALFTLTSYKDAGFTEFRDYVPSSPHKWDWIPQEFCVNTQAILDYYQDTEGDSSCVVFDKVINWDALLVTTILNGPLQHVTYQKLNGDKDTWVMAMIHTKGHLEPLQTVPGFLFVDYESNNLGRKVHGQLQLLKVDEERGYRDDLSTGPINPHAEGGLIPLYFNNQLFNFTQWQYNKGWTYVGSYDDFGSLYNPPTSLSPDCAPYPVETLDPLTGVMEEAFDGVVSALASIDSKQCGCRDDWPSQCVYFIY